MWKAKELLCELSCEERRKRVHKQEIHNPGKSIWSQCTLLGSDLFYIAWLSHTDEKQKELGLELSIF